MASCYEDKGNYDYIDLPDMTIKLPVAQYNIPAGSKLIIEPEIVTTLPENELDYRWEIYSQFEEEDVVYSELFAQFHTLNNESSDPKRLEYTCVIDGQYIQKLTSYRIRLHVVHTPTQRDFYSNQSTLAVGGKAGLMVIHDNGSTSDIGLVVASEFMRTAGQTPEVEVTADFYSSINGARLQGKGVMLYHANPVVETELRRTYFVAITDQVGEFVAIDFAKYQDWDFLFYGGLHKRKGNSKPEGIVYTGMQKCYFDGGEVYVQSGDFATFPVISEKYATYSKFDVAPFFVFGNYKLWLFDRKARGFLSTLIGMVSDNSVFGPAPVNTSGGLFNLYDMQADLLWMDNGGAASHILAVMQKDDKERFLVEINAADAVVANQAYARYDDVSMLPGFNQAVAYAFGYDQVNMCYYAAPNQVYRYTVFNRAISGVEPLCMTDGSPLKLDDGTPVDFSSTEVTCCRLLKPFDTLGLGTILGVANYFNYNKLLVVGTFSGGKGTVYSMAIDQMTGRVTKVNKYEGNFGYIRDVNIKFM
ncbi:MAG: hypothetical protein LBR67_02665 [Dysgonamonadaceae bacterium]|nr:hypothetical protein [Dysgonamonadaceae bacterium]